MSLSGQDPETSESKQVQDPGYLVLDALAHYGSMTLFLGFAKQVFEGKTDNSSSSVNLTVSINDKVFQERFSKIFPWLQKVESKDPIPASYLTLMTDQARQSSCEKLQSLQLENLEASDAEMVPFLDAYDLALFPKLTTLQLDGWKLSQETLRRLARLEKVQVTLTNKVYGIAVHQSYENYFLPRYEKDKTNRDHMLVLSRKEEEVVLVAKKGNAYHFYPIEKDCVTRSVVNTSLDSLIRYEDFFARLRVESRSYKPSDYFVREADELLKDIVTRYGFTIGYLNEYSYDFQEGRNDKLSQHIIYFRDRKKIEEQLSKASLFSSSEFSHYKSLIPQDNVRFKESVNQHPKGVVIEKLVFNPTHSKPYIECFEFLLSSPAVIVSMLEIQQGDEEEQKVLQGEENKDPVSESISAVLELLKTNKKIRHLLVKQKLSSMAQTMLEEILQVNNGIRYLSIHLPEQKDGETLLKSTASLRALHVKIDGTILSSAVVNCLKNSPLLNFFNLSGDCPEQLLSEITAIKHPSLLQMPFLNYDGREFRYAAQDFVAATIVFYQAMRNSALYPQFSLISLQLFLAFLAPPRRHFSMNPESHELLCALSETDKVYKEIIFLMEENMLAKIRYHRIVAVRNDADLISIIDRDYSKMENDTIYLSLDNWGRDDKRVARTYRKYQHSRFETWSDLSEQEFEALKQVIPEQGSLEIKSDAPLFDEMLKRCECYKWNKVTPLWGRYQLFKPADDFTRSYYLNGRTDQPQDHKTAEAALPRSDRPAC